MAEVPTDLYRSCKSSAWGKADDKRAEKFAKDEGKTSVYPDFTGFMRKDGTVRAPDVTTFKVGEELWVYGVQDKDSKGGFVVSRKEGVSVSTAVGGFGYSGWFYFLLPKGTSVPASLDVEHTPSRNDNGHYSIRCKNQMRVDSYKGALDTLARSAIAKAVEQAKQSLYFS
jgi:hypothetical protein